MAPSGRRDDTKEENVEWLAVIAPLVIVLAVRPIRSTIRHIDEARAIEAFRLRRAEMEEMFVRLALARGDAEGKPPETCLFTGDPVRIARDPTVTLLGRSTRSSREIVAFARVMVDDRPGSALFLYHAGEWGTDGRVLAGVVPESACAVFDPPLTALGGVDAV